MELGLEGRVALITGAAGGVGRAVAAELSREGVRVALADRDADAVGEVGAALIAKGLGASAHPLDVTDEAQVAAVVADVVSQWGGIDLLVGSAGISGPVGTPVSETALADFSRVLAVNVIGAFLVLARALPALRASNAASVVFIASDSALVAAPGMAAYCASKGALVQFARAAAVELEADGVRVNAVCPSIIDTPMSRRDLGLETFDRVDYPVQTPADVAAQVAFLCSPRSRPVNAAALVSDFGYSARSNFPA